jgi:hypothetical protein
VAEAFELAPTAAADSASPAIPISADTSTLTRRRWLTILTADFNRCAGIPADPLALLRWVNDECHYTTRGIVMLGMSQRISRSGAANSTRQFGTLSLNQYAGHANDAIESGVQHERGLKRSITDGKHG